MGVGGGGKKKLNFLQLGKEKSRTISALTTPITGERFVPYFDLKKEGEGSLRKRGDKALVPSASTLEKKGDSRRHP